MTVIDLLLFALSIYAILFFGSKFPNNQKTLPRKIIYEIIRYMWAFIFACGVSVLNANLI